MDGLGGKGGQPASTSCLWPRRARRIQSDRAARDVGNRSRYVCVQLLHLFLLNLASFYLVEARHLSLNSMGLYTMFSFGGMAVVGIPAGWAADRLIERGAAAVRVRKMFTILGFVIASTEVVGALSSSRSVALFFAVFSLAGLGLDYRELLGTDADSGSARAIGRAVGVQNFASNTSGAVAALLTGWLKQSTGSYEAPMLAVLAILLLGLFSYGWLVKTNLRTCSNCGRLRTVEALLAVFARRVSEGLLIRCEIPGRSHARRHGQDENPPRPLCVRWVHDTARGSTGRSGGELGNTNSTFACSAIDHACSGLQ